MRPSRQTLLVFLAALGASVSYRCLNGAYDRADRRKAELLVRTLTGKDGRSLEDVLARVDPSAHADSAWSAEILSSCRGSVRVVCRLRPGPYSFDVDLVRKHVGASNELARVVLEALGRTNSSPPR